MMMILYTVADAVALFWGYDSYNNELLQADELRIGSVTTEILLKKEMGSFTLSNGWAFPRRIYFNGESCQMPPPDNFPMLPNHGQNQKHGPNMFIFLTIYILFHLFWALAISWWSSLLIGYSFRVDAIIFLYKK